MRLGQFDFRPGLLPTLAFLLVLPLLLALGNWQLERAHYKDRVAREQADRASLGPLEVNLGSLQLEADRYQAAMARGRYLQGRQWLLDNQLEGGRAGYHVFSLLLLDDAQRGLLVDRGWVEVGGDRQQLPDVPVGGGRRVVEGQLNPPPRVGLRLDPPPGADDEPLVVVQEIRPDEIAQRLGIAVDPLVLRLAPAGPDGYLRNWKRPVRMGADKHRGYAFQWFALATTLVIIYLVVNTRRTGRREASDGGTDQG